MKSAIVKENYFKFVRIKPAEFIEKYLETVGIAFGQFKCKMAACNWREGAGKIEVFELVLVGDQRLHTPDCQYSSRYG